MKTKMNFLMVSFITLLLSFSSVFAAGRNVAEWNLDSDNLAVQGHDVVSYFEKNANKATLGKSQYEITHEGVVYRFSTRENLEIFLANPEKYEPAHGGWCSTAMAFNQKIGIDPNKFVINGNRLFLFSFLNGSDGKVTWEADAARLERRADSNWKRISGEEPRK